MKYTSISLLIILLNSCQLFAGNQFHAGLGHYHLLLGLLGILGLGLASHIIVMYWQTGTELKKSGKED